MFFRWRSKAKPEPVSDVPTVYVEKHEPRRRTEWPARDGQDPKPAPLPPQHTTVPPQARTMPPQPREAAPPPDDERTRLVTPGQRPGAPRAEELPPPPDRHGDMGYPPEPVYAPTEERTRLFRGEPANASAEGQARLSDDPVVGWLVLVEGPGKGRSVEIGSGANSVGRSPGQQIRIDFGDDLISRERHAILIFDPRTQRFFLERGDGRNLTYVGESPVLSPVELVGGETIIIGKTQCRFVRLCGDDFTWA